MHRPSLCICIFYFVYGIYESLCKVESYAPLETEEITLKHALQVCNIELDFAF